MRWLTVIAALATVVACESGGILSPPTGPNTSYPCGVGGFYCERICCAEGYVCEHNPARCEFFGGSVYDKRGDAGR